MKILFLDTETTGLDERINKIIEITAHLYDSETAILLESLNIKLEYGDSAGPISLGALAVNGVTINEVRDGTDDSLDYSFGLTTFADWLVAIKRKHKDFAVAGHNVHFDIKFLTEAFNSIGLTDLEQLIGHRYMDTAGIAVFLKDLGLITSEKPSTKDLAKEFSFDPPKHTTTADVEFTWKLYNKLKFLVQVRSDIIKV